MGAQSAVPDHEFNWFNKVIAFNDPAFDGFRNLPISDTEKAPEQKQGLLRGEPGTYNFEVRDVAFGLENDWRGEALGVDYVIRWQGPSGRYRELSTNPGAQDLTGENIVSRGQLLAKLPENLDVLGACVTDAYEDPDWPGRPLLNVIVDPRVLAFPQEFQLWRRPADIANNDTSLFDPDESPDGWKIVGSAAWDDDFDITSFDTFYAGSTFFNASGTEARMMFPLDPAQTPSGAFEQVQLQFLTGTLSQFTMNRIGQGFNLERTIDTTFQQTNNITGTCGSSLSVQNGSTNGSATSTISWVGNGSPVAWVDWKGDTPVFATWEVPTGGSGSSSASFNITCTGSSNEDARGTFSFSNSGSLQDEGILKITLAGKTLAFDQVGGCNFATESGSVTGEVTRTGGIGQGGPVVLCDFVDETGVETTNRQETRHDGTRIYYSDLRYDLVMYTDYIRTIDQTDVVEISGPASTFTRTTNTVTTTKHILSFNGTDHVLFEDTVVDNRVNVSPPGGLAPLACGGIPTTPGTCAPTGSGGDSSSSNHNPVPTQFGLSDSVDANRVGVSRDGEILFYSLFRDFNNPQTNNMENFLTGGDPVAIMGLTGPNPRMLGIELIF
jgi:hypothetical protein